MSKNTAFRPRAHRKDSQYVCLLWNLRPVIRSPVCRDSFVRSPLLLYFPGSFPSIVSRFPSMICKSSSTTLTLMCRIHVYYKVWLFPRRFFLSLVVSISHVCCFFAVSSRLLFACLALSSSCSLSVCVSFVLAQVLFSSLSACLLIHGLHLSPPFALLLPQISQTSIEWQGGLNCKSQIGRVTAECSARRLSPPHCCDQSFTLFLFLLLCLGPCLCLKRGDSRGIRNYLGSPWFFQGFFWWRKYATHWNPFHPSLLAPFRVSVQ